MNWNATPIKSLHYLSIKCLFVFEKSSKREVVKSPVLELHAIIWPVKSFQLYWTIGEGLGVEVRVAEWSTHLQSLTLASNCASHLKIIRHSTCTSGNNLAWHVHHHRVVSRIYNQVYWKTDWLFSKNYAMYFARELQSLISTEECLEWKQLLWSMFYLPLLTSNKTLNPSNAMVRFLYKISIKDVDTPVSYSLTITLLHLDEEVLLDEY